MQASLVPLRTGERLCWNLGPSPLNIPEDPRCWTRGHVSEWINFMTSLHRLPSVPSDRFAMNGKALCLMNIEMFLARVPLGGKLLYKDFQLRLGKAIYKEINTM